mmetsp:Transcript_12260/g.27606  ORF Transcript_12260/g.27606 Transcript_12260/m.27606 type:complete len:225 (+) Transcript_12260:276-950(+)
MKMAKPAPTANQPQKWSRFNPHYPPSRKLPTTTAIRIPLLQAIGIKVPEQARPRLRIRIDLERRSHSILDLPSGQERHQPPPHLANERLVLVPIRERVCTENSPQRIIIHRWIHHRRRVPTRHRRLLARKACSRLAFSPKPKAAVQMLMLQPMDSPSEQPILKNRRLYLCPLRRDDTSLIANQVPSRRVRLHLPDQVCKTRIRLVMHNRLEQGKEFRRAHLPYR